MDHKRRRGWNSGFGVRRTWQWVSLVVLSVSLLATPSTSRAQSSTPVAGPPSITLEQLTAVLQPRNTPLLAYVDLIFSEGVAHNIDPAFAIAMWAKESQWGTTGASMQTRNMGNLVCLAAAHPPATSCSGRWAVYPTWADAIRDWYAYIERRYIRLGLNTVESIIPVYAPEFENDTALYVRQITTWMKQWGSTTVGTGPPATAPGSWLDWTIDIGGEFMDSIYRMLQQILYYGEQLLAAFIWAGLRAFLNGVVILNRFRELVTLQGFRPAIESISETIGPLLMPVLGLALAVALALLSLRPVAVLRWVRIQQVGLLLIALPFLLPAMASLYQTTEEARATLGSDFYSLVSDDVTFDLADDTNTAPGLMLDNGEIPPFQGGDSTIQGIDISAAYLYARASDVLTPTTTVSSTVQLPKRFTEVYMPDPPSRMEKMDAADRWGMIQLAGQGIIRLLFGTLLVAFAVLETLTTFCFSLALGCLMIALVIALLYSWISLGEHIVARLVQQILGVLLATWGISVLQALLMAAMINITESGNADAVVGIGLFACALQLAFLLASARTMLGAFVGGLSAFTGGTVTATDLAFGSQTVGNALAKTGDAVYRGVERVDSRISSTIDAADNYHAARVAGNSRTFSAGYAASGSRMATNVASLALAMGMAAPGDEFTEGMFSGNVIGRAEPSSFRSRYFLPRSVLSAGDGEANVGSSSSSGNGNSGGNGSTPRTAPGNPSSGPGSAARGSTIYTQPTQRWTASSSGTAGSTATGSGPSTPHAQPAAQATASATGGVAGTSAPAQQTSGPNGVAAGSVAAGSAGPPPQPQAQTSIDGADVDNIPDAATVQWPSDIRTGQPFRSQVFQGRGASRVRVYGAANVRDGRAGPVFGPGQYYARTRQQAARYGGTITPHEVALQNPFVLESDAQLFALLDEADARHLDPGGQLSLDDPAGVPAAAQRLQTHLRQKGHDGLIVRLHDDETIIRAKRLRELAAHDQVVVFEQQKRGQA